MAALVATEILFWFVPFKELLKIQKWNENRLVKLLIVTAPSNLKKNDWTGYLTRKDVFSVIKLHIYERQSQTSSNAILERSFNIARFFHDEWRYVLESYKEYVNSLIIFNKTSI